MKLQTRVANLNYEITGSGDPLVLVHGAGDNMGAWYNQVPEFSKQYSVITPDVRGHGDTVVTDGDYSVDACVEDIYQLIKSLGFESAAVLGYSMGGGIVTNLTLKHPAIVRALVISNSGGGLGPPPTPEQQRQREERQKLSREALERGDMETLFKDRLANSFSPGYADNGPKDQIEKYRAVFMANDPKEYLKRTQAGGAAGSPDYSKISCPTLIIVGEYDQNSGPAAGEAMQKLISGSQLKVFRTGHASPIEVPEEYNKTVLGFLASVKTTA